MKYIFIFILIIFLIPLEKLFFPGLNHLISFSLVLLFNFISPYFYIFPFSFFYAIAVESFNPYRLWLEPFYFSLLPFFVLWFKRNMNYKIFPVSFLFNFLFSLIFFLLLSFSKYTFLKSLICAGFLTLFLNLWKNQK